MKYKNMKIEINDEQQFDSVAKELERMNIKPWKVDKDDKFIFIRKDIFVYTSSSLELFNDFEPTTLQ